MSSVNMEPDQWQLGKTKVFVKSPESVSYMSGLCLATLLLLLYEWAVLSNTVTVVILVGCA